MRFRKIGDSWKPVSSDEILREAMLSGGALLLLFAMLLAAVLGASMVVLALAKYNHPIMTPVGILIEFRWGVGVAPAFLFVAGFAFGWETTGDKRFEAVVLEK